MAMLTKRQMLLSEIKELRMKEFARQESLRAVQFRLAQKEEELRGLPLDPEDELEMLEQECSEVEYVVNQEKGIIVAAVLKSLFTGLTVGVAQCHPDDKFEPTIGKLVALKRALGIRFNPLMYGEEREDFRGCDNCKYREVFVGDMPCVLCNDGDAWIRRAK